MGNQSVLLIELKFPRRGVYKDLAREVLKQIRFREVESQVLLQSFEPRYLKWISRRNFGLSFGPLLGCTPAWFPLHRDRKLRFQPFEPLEGSNWIGLSLTCLSKRFVKRCHRAGMLVGAYKVNDVEAMQHIDSLGVGCLITDHPAEVIRLFKEA